MQLIPQNIPQRFFAGCHCVVIVKGIIVVTTQLACVMSVFWEINFLHLSPELQAPQLKHRECLND